MPATIIGIATALPPHRIRQTDAATIARAFSCETTEQDRMFSAIFRRSGVESRGSVVLEASEGDLASRQSFYGESNPTTLQRMERYEAAAAPLGEEAARGALEAARVDPRRITHVVTVSCSGFLAPGVDQALMRTLGLAADVERTHVGFMGCHGLLNGLRVARAFVEADESACVLLCAVELCSLHLQYGWDSERMVANALFADGAAAMVIAAASGARRVEPGDLAIRAVGSTVFPGQRGRDVVADRRPRVRHDALAARARVNRPRPATVALGVARRETALRSSRSARGPCILAGRESSRRSESRCRSNDRRSRRRSASWPSTGTCHRRRSRSSWSGCGRPGAPRPWVAMAFGPGLAVEVALLG